MEPPFDKIDGVLSTTSGYSGGPEKNPTYRQVASGQTGHTEVVQIAYDPKKVSYEKLLKVFWESHDPTQGMRQGNDIGTQYRSGLYLWTDEERALAQASQAAYQAELSAAGLRQITTEILPMPSYYLAEAYHQQYLHKNPNGYCGLGGTGVSCPLPALKP